MKTNTRISNIQSAFNNFKASRKAYPKNSSNDFVQQILRDEKATNVSNVHIFAIDDAWLGYYILETKEGSFTTCVDRSVFEWDTLEHAQQQFFVELVGYMGDEIVDEFNNAKN